MPESAIIVPVPEAKPFVSQLRERFDPSARLGVPAHITVIHPFVQPDRVTEPIIAQMRRFASEHSAFAYSLNSTGRFRDTLYLAPDPAQPFVNLVKGLVQYFPAHALYRGQFESIVPHLTVAHGEGLPLRELEAELSSQGFLKTGIPAYCEMLVLIENTSGLWRERDRFALATSVR